MGTKIRLLSVLVLALLFSCTQDTIETESNKNVNLSLKQGQYDNSNLGVYKGVFSTLDNEDRGTIEVALTNGELAIAEITLESGEIIQLASSTIVGGQVMTESIQFESNPKVSTKTSFTFSVDPNGENPLITDVIYNTIDAGVLVVKETSRTPVNPITGTYDCVNCAEMNPAWASGTRTFSMIFTGDGAGAQSIATQAIFGGLSFTSPNPSNTQSNCNPSGGGNRICSIEGTSAIFNRTLNWTGTHEYKVSAVKYCSFVEGTWEMVTSYGTIFGTFEGGDASCL